MRIRVLIRHETTQPVPCDDTHPSGPTEPEDDEPAPGETPTRHGLAGLCHSDPAVVDGTRPRDSTSPRGSPPPAALLGSVPVDSTILPPNRLTAVSTSQRLPITRWSPMERRSGSGQVGRSTGLLFCAACSPGAGPKSGFLSSTLSRT